MSWSVDHAKPRAVLGLAIGSTSLGCCRKPVRMHKHDEIDYDEWIQAKMPNAP